MRFTNHKCSNRFDNADHDYYLVLKEIEREDVSRQKKQEKARLAEAATAATASSKAEAQSTAAVPEAARPPARGMSSFF